MGLNTGMNCQTSRKWCWANPKRKTKASLPRRFDNQ